MKNKILILGDMLALALVTLIGFVTHREADLSFLPRFLAIYIPLSLCWFLLAPWFGLFQHQITSIPKNLWRVVFVMFFAAPLAVVLRGLILNTSVVPIFAVVLSATSALGMSLWRGVFALLVKNH